MKFRDPATITEENPLKPEELRALLNEVLNVDVSDVAIGDEPTEDTQSKVNTMENEVPEEVGAESAGPAESAEAPSNMTLADLAAEVGVDEEALMARMQELDIATPESIDGVLEAVSNDPDLLASLVDLLKNGGGGMEGAAEEETGGII